MKNNQDGYLATYHLKRQQVYEDRLYTQIEEAEVLNDNLGSCCFDSFKSKTKISKYHELTLEDRIAKLRIKIKMPQDAK